MEYNPVAINEVLAYQFTYRDSTTDPATPKQTPRLFIELVNTLTEAEDRGGTASNLDLDGLGVGHHARRPAGRPDPFTGQIPSRPGDDHPGDPRPGRLAPSPGAGARAGRPPLRRPSRCRRRDYYYVLGNDAPDQSDARSHRDRFPLPSLRCPPAADRPLRRDRRSTRPRRRPLRPADAAPADAHRRRTSITVLYLLRPANPFDTAYDPHRTRWSWSIASGSPSPRGAGRGSTDATTHGHRHAGDDAALLRAAAPALTGAGTPSRSLRATRRSPPTDAYGYTEQTCRRPRRGDRGPGDGRHVRRYRDPGGTGDGKITQPIYNTIGAKNDPSENWDYLPFHDRDFTSVAELLMVPGCPPGLFTKVFAEAAPPIASAPGRPAADRPDVTAADDD